ncbi:MAG: Gfo/Idh/MocA family oxidoreductase [Eubacteriales bacterium]|nr:Gfo/Idh/MocA family oxidoreductase [Eubacteriales bacterium]
MENRLKFGMVGGGNNGNIGNSHRIGATIDNSACLVAGCFTRNSELNKRDGEMWGVATDRIYETYQEMAEVESKRQDKIDFVSIVTPNHLHYLVAKCFLEHGINVVCEKPFTLSVNEAEALKALAAQNGLEICITYTYPHYPILQECKKLIQTGTIGRIIDIVAEYPQDWMILGLAQGEQNYTSWIGDPAKSGNSNVTAAIGVHLFYLIKSMTGLELESVLASFDYYPENAPLETVARIILKYSNGVKGLCWMSNVAIGHDCSISLKIYGDKGSIQWTHEDQTHLHLAMLGRPVQILSANRDYLGSESRKASRLPAGHPEGFYEAYGNIYRAFIQFLMEKKRNALADAESYFFPKAVDGVAGVRFVQACVESQKNGNTWTRLADM